MTPFSSLMAPRPEGPSRGETYHGAVPRSRTRPRRRHAPMVGWFDPGQLLSTGIKVVVSEALGLRWDRRLAEAFSQKERTYYDYSVHYREQGDGSAAPDPGRP